MNRPAFPVRLWSILALVAALGRPALADDREPSSGASGASGASEMPAAPALAPPGHAAPAEPPAGPDWNAAPEPEAADRQELRWYGKQILVVDAVGAGLMVYTALVGDENVFWASTATLLLGSPIVHGMNGQVGNTLLSIPLRVLMPLAGAALAADKFDFCDFDCNGPSYDGLAVGAALGLAVASIIDIAILAHDRPARSTAPGRPWAPHVAVTGNGFSASIGGTF